MINKASFKTILMIVKDIGFMIIFYSFLSSKVPLFLNTFSILILSTTLVALVLLRKEKSSYELNEDGNLEKIYRLISILVSIVALWTLVSIFFIKR